MCPNSTRLVMRSRANVNNTGASEALRLVEKGFEMFGIARQPCLTLPHELAARARNRLRGVFLCHGLPTDRTLSAPHIQNLNFLASDFAFSTQLTTKSFASRCSRSTSA